MSPSSCVNKYRGMYILIQCVTRGGGVELGGLGQINTCRQVPLRVNFYEKPTIRVFGVFLDIYEGYGGGGGGGVMLHPLSSYPCTLYPSLFQ